MKNFALLLGIILCTSCSIFKKSENVVEIRTDQLLFKDDFLVLLDVWIIETPQKSDSVVFVKDNKLIINAEKGITIWLNKKLSANYVISFKRKILVADGPYDRLSDMNVFWMATDPKNKDLFTRSGVFEEYDTLSLYYIGMGGNTNTTTRFRKYIDFGNKPIIKEYLDKDHLLEPNKEYSITISVKDGTTEYFVNGKRYFSYRDENPLVQGYFAFRTTASHQEIKDFKIFTLR